MPRDFRPIGDRLAEARSLLGLSQHEMARELGLSGQSYGRYERGERPLPTSAISVLPGLGISSIWVLTGDGKPLLSEPTAQYGALSARLDEIASLASSGFETHERELVRVELELLSANAGIAPNLRRRAESLLSLAFGDAVAEARRQWRGSKFNDRLRAAGAAYQAIVSEMKWVPPPSVGMAIRDAMVTDGLSEEAVKQILSALRVDLDRSAEGEDR